MIKNDSGWNLENTYQELPELFYSQLDLKPVSKPGLVIINEPLAKKLGLKLDGLKNQDGLNFLAGNELPIKSKPIAQAYAGHQFGHFTMLGDGRAMLIGEQITPAGDRFDIQLKGSGKTPYSRGGDGRATLGPMLREYIISEAMHHLGIPTSRSLAVVTTGDRVYREKALEGAILSRVTSSHIRVGTFEYASQWGSLADLKALADYSIKRHFPYLAAKKNVYLGLLKEVIKRQADLIAKWQLVGFVHGVMNTDNVTIAGETIDYGPCAFMDSYDPKTVFSSIDLQGRYAYQNQPGIGLWNLARFAESLIPLIDDKQDQAIELAEAAIHNFALIYQAAWLSGIRAKLGIFNEEKEDEMLISELLGLMKRHRADYTNTFVDLSYNQAHSSALYESDAFSVWDQRWKMRLTRQDQGDHLVKDRMKKSNPVVIPRNNQVEKVLAAATNQNDYQPLHNLLDLLKKPYHYDPLNKEYMQGSKDSDPPYKTYCGT